MNGQQNGEKMDDHTYISLAGIAAGVILLVSGMVAGNMDASIVGIAGAAIGAGVGVPLGAQFQKTKDGV